MAYIIKSGDSLGKIASQNGTTVQALLQANPTIKDPNKISAGASLNLPGQQASQGGYASNLPVGVLAPNSKFSIPSATPSPTLTTSPYAENTASKSFETKFTPTPAPSNPFPGFLSQPKAQQNQQVLTPDITNSNPQQGITDSAGNTGNAGGGVTGNQTFGSGGSSFSGNSITNTFKKDTNINTGGAGSGVSGGSPQKQFGASEFANVIESMRSKLAYNNDLINARQLMVTQLYDHPLTEQEIAKLPQNFQDIARSGDNRAIEMRIRLLNDEIQGRTNTMDQSVAYLTGAYKNDLERAETEKQNSMDNVLKFIAAYGDQAGEALKTLYGQDYLDQLASYGINVEGVSGMPKTLNQIEAEQNASNNGLTPAQINSTVNSIAGAFDNEPTVKNFNTVKEGYQFVQTLGNKANPTSSDDQGLVYAFAKAMDPNSAVKEGEYITIQKYNQSFIQSGWASAKRIVANEAFLTPEARKNMIETIKTKYDTAKIDYNDLHSEYQRQMNDAQSGKPRQLTNYDSTRGGDSNDPAYQEYQQYLKSTGATSFNMEGSGSKNAMRTDRHNNPTAFTTDIAKLAGLKEGVDYTKGDPFSGGKYYTANLLGDPIDTTIKAIDKIGFQTASGKPRWDYINIPKSQWDKMSYDEKKNVIGQMYQREGGSQLDSYFA